MATKDQIDNSEEQSVTERRAVLVPEKPEKPKGEGEAAATTAGGTPSTSRESATPGSGTNPSLAGTTNGISWNVFGDGGAQCPSAGQGWVRCFLFKMNRADSGM